MFMSSGDVSVVRFSEYSMYLVKMISPPDVVAQ